MLFLNSLNPRQKIHTKSHPKGVKKKTHIPHVVNSTGKKVPPSWHTQGEENERDVLALEKGKLKSRRWCDLHVSCRGFFGGGWPEEMKNKT